MNNSKRNNFDVTFASMYIAGFVILIASLFYYQILKGDYYLARARNNYMRVIPERSIRGNIYDRNGIILAKDIASFNISVIPYQIKYKKDELFRDISLYINSSSKTLNRNYKRKFQNQFSPVDIIPDVDKETAFRIKEKFGDDVLINPEPQRVYLYPYEFAHVLGYVQDASAFPENIKKYGYSPSERIGKTGIEEYYDNYLRGKDGGDLIEINSQGQIAGFLGKLNTERGQDIHLTLDLNMQEAAYAVMKNKKGALIFMDSKSGDVLSLLSAPAFNPNFFVKGSDELTGVFKDTHRPLQNRAIQSTYPLGSTFKPVVTIAALEAKKITPLTTFNCEGKLKIGNTEFHCENVHGSENIYDALIHSCNVYFYNAGMLTGREQITKWADRLGLSSLTGIDLPYENKGFIPGSNRGVIKHWYKGDTLNLSIGQGYVLSSPIEITSAFNTFANAGYSVKPHIISKLGDTDFRPIPAVKSGIPFDILTILRNALRGVVESDEGTARMLRPLSLKISGKTGTAQAQGKAHGWFIGYFPYDDPKYTICVFLENAGSSYEALKVANEFLSQLKEKNIL
ncbi:MAG: penicillin-binding protein 2 [Candidatus Omnitrophota bacterium]|jgi:penicillin-binding protein 2